MYGCHYAAARVCGWLHCGRVSLGVGSRRWEQILYVLREVRGASGWLRGHLGRHTSLSYDPRALRDRLLGLHSRRALSLPTSPTTCIVRTGAVTARGGRRRPALGRSVARNHSVHAYGPRWGTAAHFCPQGGGGQGGTRPASGNAEAAYLQDIELPACGGTQWRPFWHHQTVLSFPLVLRRRRLRVV